MPEFITVERELSDSYLASYRTSDELNVILRRARVHARLLSREMINRDYQTVLLRSRTSAAYRITV